MIEIDDARLREILAGCETVHAGPWEVRHRDEVWSTVPGRYIANAATMDDEALGATARLAAYIARLDPDTVKAIVTELLALRSPVEPTPSLLWQDNISTDGTRVLVSGWLIEEFATALTQRDEHIRALTEALTNIRSELFGPAETDEAVNNG